MSDTIKTDPNILRFEGNLKINITELLKIPATIQGHVIQQLEHLKPRLEKAIKEQRDCCFTFPISNSSDLFVDYRNGKLNLYIEDKRNNCYTQMLTAELALSIAKKDISICKGLEEYSKDVSQQKKENNLKSTLIHSAYNTKINNRGSPTVMGRRIDDNLNLDR